MAELWDGTTRRMSALEVTRGERTVEDTIVSFAPLLDPHLSTEVVDAIVRDLRSASFHPDRPDGYVVPSFDLKGAGFDERRYWRGPVWINTNWMLWMGLRQHGHAMLAEEAASSLGLVARSGSMVLPTPSTDVGSDRRVRLDGPDHRPHRAARRGERDRLTTV
jgi:hypothetical protein